MRLSIICFVVCFFLIGCKEEAYSSMIAKAQLLSNNKDSIKHLSALKLYEKAFKKFPDSIDEYSTYKITLLASEFKKYDVAFKYLIPLAELEEDEEGYPGWTFILDEYADEDYKNLIEDGRWSALKQQAEIDKTLFFERLKIDEKEFFNVKERRFDKLNANETYNYIRKENFYLPKQKRDYSISFKISDTVKTSYFVHLPKDYSPKKTYPLMVYMHGAVRDNKLSEFETKGNLKYFNRFYTKYANKEDVILVFPRGDKTYNWMLNNDGFFMVPEIIKQLKKTININDNKVFVSGHSNGATGSFSYLIKQPSQFAGFSGFNTQPKVHTGGTFIENLLNRSFINISTDKDYYYPPNANDSLNKLMLLLKADYKEYRYNGFPHWFPNFDESEPAHKIIFNDLVLRQRNPYPKNITWEFDDNNYGTVDWISDSKLDTLIEKKSWHKNLNFDINSKLKYENDSLISIKVDEKAFDFPRKSGKILANYKDNVFNIKTSCIESFKINISPEMVNLEKNIKVYLNNKLSFNGKVKYNKAFLLNNFDFNKDKKQLWVNYITLQVNY